MLCRWARKVGSEAVSFDFHRGYSTTPPTVVEEATSSENTKFHTAEHVLSEHRTAFDALERDIRMQDRKRSDLLHCNQNVWLTELPRIEKDVLGDRGRLIQIGSAITGLGEASSDIDLVFYPSNSSERQPFVEAFHSDHSLRADFLAALRGCMVRSLVALPSTSPLRAGIKEDQLMIDHCMSLPNVFAPVIKCQLTNGFSIDVVIPDTKFHSIRNTSYVRYYAQTDPRLSRMTTWLRKWGDALRIRESTASLLSSYHLTFLAIHFLQSVDSMQTTPVLPSLMKIHPELVDPTLPIQEVVDQLKRPPPPELKKWKSSNDMSTAELIYRFLQYYGYRRRLGSNVFRLEKAFTNKPHDSSYSGPPRLLDPYSDQSILKTSASAWAFEDAVVFTSRKMQKGRMLTFPNFDDAEEFVKRSSQKEWRQFADEKSKRLRDDLIKKKT